MSGEDFDEKALLEEDAAIRAQEMADDYAAVLRLLDADDKLGAAWAEVELERKARKQAEKMYGLKVAELEEMKKEAARWKKKALAAIGLDGKK